MKPRAPQVRSLADLSGLKASLAEARAREAEHARREAQARERAEAERQLFARAAGPVRPLAVAPRAAAAIPAPEPVPRQFLADERAALDDSLSDAFDASTLLEVDEQLSYRQSGIGSDVPRKLRRGHWSIQAELDLHGRRSDQAREALVAFLRDAQRAGLRCVRVIHGKGLGSPGKTPVLKNKVHGWLVQRKEVLAFVQARPADGGAGALVVLLAPGAAP